MATLTTILLASSVVIAAVGAGVSAYTSIQAGKTQSAIANYNAKLQEKQAQQQALSLQTQAAQRKQEAETNYRLRQAEAQARINNAESIEAQAISQARIDRANAIKRGEDYARAQSEQRAAIAASGLVESAGTPLDLLAETAAKIQSSQEEQHYIEELNRRTLFREAEMERLGGKLALAGATLDRDSGIIEAGLRDATSRAAYSAGMSQAEITRLTGRAAAKAGRYEGAATLLNSASKGVGQYGIS